MKIKKVYLGRKQIYPEVSREPYTPTANTKLFIKWEWNITDYSGNSVTTTAKNISYATEWSLTYINLAGNSANGITFNMSLPKPITFSVWISPGTWWSSSPRFLENQSWGGSYYLRAYRKSTSRIVLNDDVDAYMTPWVWQNVVITVSWSNAKVYINGTQAYSWSYSKGWASWVWSIWYKSSNNDDYMNAKLSNIIIENIARTAEQVTTNYNKIKSLYGIS